MTQPPGSGIDRTLTLLKQGYLFLPQLHWKYRSDVVRIRLMGKPALCLSGAEAAEMFYGEPRIVRSGAIPNRIRRTLLGDDGVQTLDGDAHRVRKALFMEVLAPARVDGLLQAVEHQLACRIGGWFAGRSVVVMSEAEQVLTAAACRWAGIPIPGQDVSRRASDLAGMVDGFGVVGPAHWQARLARKKSERWAKELIQSFRAGSLDAPSDTALYRVSCHRDANGELLPAETAAVELLNVIRPTVAVGRWVAYLALALHLYGAPGDDAASRQRFIQEVRRFFPFTPFVGGRIAEPFGWEGYAFPAGAMALFDVYGLNRDRRIWQDPQRFDPSRFEDLTPGPYGFIPQGGGDAHTGHRCAGEDLTLAVLDSFARAFTTAFVADLPPQDLSVDPGRIPTKPASGVILDNVRPLT